MLLAPFEGLVEQRGCGADSSRHFTTIMAEFGRGMFTRKRASPLPFSKGL